MIREISLKLSRTARRAFFYFFSAGQNLLKTLSPFSVCLGFAILKQGKVELWQAIIWNDLQLVLCDGTSSFEDWATVYASHNHRATLHYLMVDSNRFSCIMDHVLPHNLFGLWWVHWNEAGACQLVMARPYDVLSLNRSRKSRFRYVLEPWSCTISTHLLAASATVRETGILIDVELI